jgi:hypothetical protein
MSWHRLAPWLALLMPLAACDRCNDPRFRDTRGYVKARLEFEGELAALGATTLSPELRASLGSVWAERLKRLREAGLLVVDSARFPSDTEAPERFSFTVDVRVPPPCEAEATGKVGRDVWEVLANRGDFGVHTIDDGLRATAANFLRSLDGVSDVTTAATHRGLLVVQLNDPTALPGVLEQLAPQLASANGFAVSVPSADVTSEPGDPKRVFLAVVRTSPALDGAAVASAEASPERNGYAQVSVVFRDSAVPALASLTEKELGRHVLVLHDGGEFLAAPVIGSVVRDGSWSLRLPSIIGPNRAESLAAVLGAGSLPLHPTLKHLRHGCVRDAEPGTSQPGASD